MSNVSEWSTSAGSNNDAPPDGAPEGMLPGKVNDCIRENMAALAKWYQDQNATLTTAGTGAAYTLATNSSYAALSDIPLLLFRTHTASTGACTLNVDGLGAKPLRKNGNVGDYASGELFSGQTVVAAYNSGTDDFEVVGPAIDNASAIPAGTAMLFVQTSAPTGWTKSVVHNDKALRVVSGAASSGGTTAFTSVFTSRTVAQANLPNVSFSHSLTAADHDHDAGSFEVGTAIDNGTTVVRTNSFFNNVPSTGTADDVPQNADDFTLSLADGGVFGTSDLSGALAVSGTVSSGGSGTAMDFAVQYVDVIIATKD